MFKLGYIFFFSYIQGSSLYRPSEDAFTRLNFHRLFFTCSLCASMLVLFLGKLLASVASSKCLYAKNRRRLGVDKKYRDHGKWAFQFVLFFLKMRSRVTPSTATSFII